MQTLPREDFPSLPDGAGGTKASLPEIGRAFGGKHHSTVLHSIRKIQLLRKREDFDSLIAGFIEGIR